MSIDILGISGSPTKKSNTDRLIKAVLDESRAESEFVKLSTINVRPCLACYKCVSAIPNQRIPDGGRRR